MFVDLLQNTCPVIVVMLDKYVKHVQKYVRHMQKNMKNTIWIIVNNVHKYVMNVQRFVEVCRCVRECKRMVSTI